MYKNEVRVLPHTIYKKAFKIYQRPKCKSWSYSIPRGKNRENFKNVRFSHEFWQVKEPLHRTVFWKLVGLKLRSIWSHQEQDRTGGGWRWKAASTVHSSVNGFYQEHTSWTCEKVRKCPSRTQKLWLQFVCVCVKRTFKIYYFGNFFFLYLWLFLVIVAGLRLSLVLASRHYSLGAMHGLLTAVSSLVAEHRL